jgi:hypothetical protein
MEALGRDARALETFESKFKLEQTIARALESSRRAPTGPRMRVPQWDHDGIIMIEPKFIGP